MYRASRLPCGRDHCADSNGSPPTPSGGPEGRFKNSAAPSGVTRAGGGWPGLGREGGLGRVSWPAFDPELAREDEYQIVVQINGRVRGHVLAEAGLAEEEVLRRAFADPKIASFLEGKQKVKTVVVPNKLVNIVVR